MRSLEQRIRKLEEKLAGSEVVQYELVWPMEDHMVVFSDKYPGGEKVISMEEWERIVEEEDVIIIDWPESLERSGDEEE